MKLSVICPTLEEAENVERLVEEIHRALRSIDHEILIVDDDSADLTWHKAQEISRYDPRVRVLRRMQNHGLSAAVIEGFEAARGDAVACIDGDLQHDPGTLPVMLEGLSEGAEVVVGSRYVDGRATGDWSWFRRKASWTASKMAQMLLGIHLKDPLSGYFLMRRKQFIGVRRKLDGKGFKILLEILAKLQPVTVKEVPYTFRPRTRGKSKLSSKVVVQYFGQLWRLSDVVHGPHKQVTEIHSKELQPREAQEELRRHAQRRA